MDSIKTFKPVWGALLWNNLITSNENCQYTYLKQGAVSYLYIQTFINSYCETWGKCNQEADEAEDADKPVIPSNIKTQSDI